MGFALSRDLFYLSFLEAAAEFRLGLAFRSMLDRISWRFDRTQRSLACEQQTQFPIVASLQGEKRRPEMRLLFAG